MNATSQRTYIRFNGGGTVNVQGTISGGGITSTAGGGAGAPTAGTVNYNNSGNQNVGAYTYYNLTISGSGNKSLTGITTVNRTLTLNGGVLQLGGNNLTLDTATSSNILGGTFSSTCMVN